MKKLTFLLVAIFMASMGFSQTVYQSSVNSKASIDETLTSMPNYESFGTMSQNLRAPGDITYLEPFDTYLPTGWDTITMTGLNWQSHTGGNPGNCAAISYSDAPEANRQVILVSPVWTVPASNARFIFDWSTSYYWLADPATNTDDLRIMISTDGGSTWADTIWKEDDQSYILAGGNTWPYDNFVWYSASIDISAYAGQDVTFGFFYSTNVGVGGHDGVSFYLDNVGIMEAWANNLTIQKNMIDFQNPGWYSQIPYTEPVGIVSDSSVVANLGLNTEPNVHFDVSIDHATTNDFFNSMTLSDNGWTDFGPDTFDTYTTTINFMPDTTSYDTYTLKNTVLSDSTDQDTTDNVASWNFFVTCNTFARFNDLTRTLSVASYTGGGNNDELGVIFYIPNPDTVDALNFYLSSSTTVGTSCKAILYSQDPATGDWVSVIESNIYDIQAGDPGTWITIPFLTDGFTEIIPGGGLYLASIQFYFDAATETFAVGADDEVPISETGYQNSVNLHLAGTWYYITAGVPTYTLIFKDHNCYPVSNNTQTQLDIQVYPNPANNQLHVDNIEGGTISVYNLIGEKVIELANANKFNTLNTSNLSSGSYIVKVVNDNQVKTTKINIVK